jgi:hypothetical protein
MSLATKIRSLFARKSTEKSSVDSAAPVVHVGSGEQLSPVNADPPPPSVVYIHSHGFTNGVFQVAPDKEGFERFLQYCNESDKIREQQVLNRLAIGVVEGKLQQAKGKDAADRETIVEKERLAGNLAVSIGELDRSRVKMDEIKAELTIVRKETIAEYPWVPALLFLCAGIVFIAADISITKQITSWGFDMKGRDGWIYAVGLAFTAFLIKPAIDRMLEKPFQAGGHKLKLLYKGVLLGITALGLIMLFCLGKFRSDLERARNKLNDLTRKMAMVVDPTSPQYIELQAQYDSIQKGLDENVMGQNGLVLSGLLFAIGGAICLSVAFGSLKQLMNRYWILPFRMGRLNAGVKISGMKLAGLRAEHTSLLAEKEKAEGRIGASEATRLQEELDDLRQVELSLVEAFYRAQYERERALYQDGRSRGERYTLDGELKYTPSGSDRSSAYMGKRTGAEEGQPSLSTRPYTRRPFVKMRKMIADNFNKSKNNQTYDDGSEFEIVG